MKQYLAIAAVVALTACGKSDSEQPVITINSPLNGQSFTNGQTVTISAAISDNEELHDVQLTVVNTVNGNHILHEEYHPDVKTYTIGKTFTAQTGGVYRIEVMAGDHAENHTMTNVQVSTQ